MAPVTPHPPKSIVLDWMLSLESGCLYFNHIVTSLEEGTQAVRDWGLLGTVSLVVSIVGAMRFSYPSTFTTITSPTPKRDDGLNSVVTHLA